MVANFNFKGFIPPLYLSTSSHSYLELEKMRSSGAIDNELHSIYCRFLVKIVYPFSLYLTSTAIVVA